MKKIQFPIILTVCFALIAGVALADPVLVKKKAKELRDKVQADPSTNQPPAKTNAPAKPVK